MAVPLGPPQICYLSYLSRSGSTLLARLLEERYAICVAPEASLPAELLGVNGMAPVPLPDAAAAAEYWASVARLSKLSDWQLEPGAVLAAMRYPATSRTLFTALAQAYRDAVRPEDPVFLYKGDPVMPWQAKAALEALPGSRVIYMLRDPRAVLSSQRRARYAYAGGTFSHSPAHTAVEWRALAGAIGHLGPREVVMRYEALVSDPEGALDTLAAALGLYPRAPEAGGAGTREASAPTPAGGFASRIAAAERHLHPQVSQAPDPAGIDGWRKALDPGAWAVLEHLLAPDMARLGYPADAPAPARPRAVLQARLQHRAGRVLEDIRRHGATLMSNPRYFLQKIAARFGGAGASR